MNSLNTINLLKGSAVLTPEQVILEERLKKLSTIIASVVGVFTLLIVIVFLIFLQRQSMLIDQKSTLIRRISLQAEKEVLVNSIKERLNLIQLVSAKEPPWQTIVESVFAIALPPNLASVSVGNKNDLSVTVGAATIEEVKTIIDKVIELSQEKRISKPVMSSLAVAENGTVKITLEFNVTTP